MKGLVFSRYHIFKPCNYRTFSARASKTISDIVSKWEEVFVKTDVPEPRSSSELITAHVLHRKTISPMWQEKSIIQVKRPIGSNRILKVIHPLHRNLYQLDFLPYVLDKKSEIKPDFTVLIYMLHGIDRQVALCDETARQIDNLCHKRLTRLPVQYVIGEWDFLCHTLKMRPPVFIPRPETEDLVNLLYKSLHYRDDLSTLRILDIGTGSGAIIVALLHLFPDARGVAVDCNEEACRLTLENSELIGVKERLTVKHLQLGSGQNDWQKLAVDHGPFEIVVSNPPYIPTIDEPHIEPEIIRHEDHRALFSGPDGMDFIKIILNNVSCLLIQQGSLWLEVDLSQPEKIREYTENNDLGLLFEKTHLDFTNRSRFCSLVAKT